MAKSFLVSPGRAYLVIAGEGTKIVRSNGTLIDTVPEGANNVSITVDTHEIIVMDNAAKIQQLYNGNSGSSGIMTTAEGEDAGSWKVEIVSTLPEQGSAGIIYMLRTNRTGTDRYDDYIWIPADNAYELLGRRPESTSVDLSNVAKTDVANTFTKSQRVQAELYATTLNANAIDCETVVEAGHVSATSALVDSVQIAMLQAARMTILNGLSVDDKIDIQLPGMEWRRADTQYIYVDRTMRMQNANVEAALRVSNMLTLGSGGGRAPIELNGNANYLRVQTSDGNTAAELTPHGLGAMNATTCVLVTGESIALADRRNSDMPAFSVTLTTTNGELKASTNGDLILNNTITIPDTLNVHNLNVTGTVTGITAGGGDTPTIDFSNGVTIMEILTADDVIADTVTASTLSARSSLSVSSEAVIYRHSDGVLYVHGDVVNATQVAATTFIPTNIQGATFTGPLVMTKDNALELWGAGKKAILSNGDITGVYYAQIDQCTVTHALSADSAKINRASIADTLVVKDLVVTGTTTGIPTGGGGGSGEIPDPLNVANLTANAAVLGAATISNALTVPEGVYFTSHLAFRKRGGLQQVQLENPGDPNASIMLGVYSIECTAMHVTDLYVHGSIEGQGTNVHATEVWCLQLGSDHEIHSNPIEVLSPLAGQNLLVRNSLTLVPDANDRYNVYDGTNVSGCIELGMDGSHTYPTARFAVGRFTVEANSNDGTAGSTPAPTLAVLHESDSTEINGLSTSIQKFKVAIAPAYSEESAMLELTGDNAWKFGESPQFALTARVDTLKIFPSYASDGWNSPVLTLTTRYKGYSSSHVISLVGSLAHYTGDSTDHTAYYMDTRAAFYYGGQSGSYGIEQPSVYINPNTYLMTEVRALYSYHTYGYSSGTPTAIPGMYVGNMLCATALTAGRGGVLELSQFGVNAHGTYIKKPLKALDSTSDITGLYYKPVTNTILPNLWQELVTSNGRPLSSVSEYTLDENIFGLLVGTAQHPTTTSPFPSTEPYDNSAWEVKDGEFNICVSSVEFGFSTGANGLTLTWPSQVIWPDEPDGLPPTQFQPNMCYRFVARLEPVPDPNSNMFISAITYKWVTLVSQTYSYPNPWATT